MEVINTHLKEAQQKINEFKKLFDSERANKAHNVKLVLENIFGMKLIED